MERAALLSDQSSPLSDYGPKDYGAILSNKRHNRRPGSSSYVSVDISDVTVRYGDHGDVAETAADKNSNTLVDPRGMGETRTPAYLSVVGLTYTVKERPGHWWKGNFLHRPRPKEVLHNLTMTFNKGELTALVGTSGSGKTSLLDVISGRAEGQVDGVVSYKHHQCKGQVMRHKASYVLQADRLLPTLTVRETLTYMALMKLPGTLSSEHIEKKVQSVIELMGLKHVADSRIGGTMIRGVSGGEKRRITIAVQLLKDPEVLLLDEPTSGLDSFTARHLVSTLSHLAHGQGKLVLMSVHQPRSDIVNMLDKICILTNGQLAYLGKPSDMVPYFTGIGYTCPVNENPCDVYLDVTSVDRRNPTREKETLRQAQSICNTFSKSQLQQNMINTITSGLNFHYDEDDTDLKTISRAGSPSWFRIFHCLLIRMNLHLSRERSAVVGRLFELPMFVPFIVLFVGRVSLSLASVQDRLGIMYQATQAPAYMGLTNALARFPPLRELYYRETSDGMYSDITFLSAYFVHILPFNIICASIFASFLYWVAGLNDDLVSFGMFVLVCVMLTQFGEMMAVTVMGVFRSTQLSSDTTSLVFSASGFLSTGLIRSFATMPTVLKWLGYIAVHKYSTEIVVANEFHGLKFGCSNVTCAQTGDNFLHTYFPDALDHVTRNFSLMGGYTVGILIFAILMFRARGTPTLH